MQIRIINKNKSYYVYSRKYLYDKEEQKSKTTDKYLFRLTQSDLLMNNYLNYDYSKYADGFKSTTDFYDKFLTKLSKAKIKLLERM